jgi:hypothetical protein
MRGRTKVLSAVAIMAIFVLTSAIFSAKLIDVSKMPLFSSFIEPNAGSANVFVDPKNTLDSTKQTGSFVTVYINITGVSDLYTWQFNLTYNKNILSVYRITSGTFLGATKDTSSEALLGKVINATDNALGYSGFAETILGDVAGVSGNGRLVSIQFQVVGYGSTDLVISLTGNLGTMLLDSTGATITPIKTDGYFRNKYPGDINGDKYVGSGDFSILQGAYGKSFGQVGYNREADFNMDGYIGSGDFSTLQGNYGKSFP